MNDDGLMGEEAQRVHVISRVTQPQICKGKKLSPKKEGPLTDELNSSNS